MFRARPFNRPRTPGSRIIPRTTETGSDEKRAKRRERMVSGGLVTVVTCYCPVRVPKRPRRPCALPSLPLFPFSNLLFHRSLVSQAVLNQSFPGKSLQKVHRNAAGTQRQQDSTTPRNATQHNASYHQESLTVILSRRYFWQHTRPYHRESLLYLIPSAHIF